MTEPSPSPIPTTSSSQSLLDRIGPLDDLLKDHPSVTLAITVLVLPLVIWLGKQAWKTWKRKRHAQRVAARRQQLPPALPPFTVETGTQQLTLEPAQPQPNCAPEGMSIVRLLSARSTPVPFLDRAEALTRLETWARSEERFAIHVLGGDGGSGKTRLGVELCRRLTTPNTHRQGAEVWQAGFLQNIKQSDNTSSSDDASSLLLVVDYAEARPEMVTEVINAALRAAEDPERRRVRIVFLVRRPSPLSVTHQSSNKWLDALRPQKSQNEGVNLILDEASTIILSDEELSDREREELFEAAYRSFTEPSESPPASDIIEQLNDPMYSQPLLVTVDAFLNARPQSRTQQSCSPSELFEEVLCHEEHYWAEHWPSSLAVNADRHHQTEGTATPTDTQGNLNRKLARQAVAAATLTDIQDEEDAISLLQLLPTDSGNNTKDLAQWLRACYPPHTNGNNHPALWCGHLEPDCIGEHLVASEADSLVPLLREILSPHRVGTSSLRTWTVLERVSTDPHLNEHVGRILNDVLVEVTQAVHAQAIDSQSTDLATGFAKIFSAVRTHIDPNKAHEAEQALSEGGDFTTFLECELAQCAADITRPADNSSETDRATYASRQLSLSRNLAASGRRAEALETAQEATALYRTLAKYNPAAYTPSLARSLNILAQRLAEQGRLDEALTTAHQATNLYTTLANQDPA
ncbi:anaphase-promoting protein, partial [Actinomyces oris]